MTRIDVAQFSRHSYPCVLTIEQVFYDLGDIRYLTLFLPRKRTILTIHDCEMAHRASGLKRLLLRLVRIRLPVARHASSHPQPEEEARP
jgi:hypothetical protein